MTRQGQSEALLRCNDSRVVPLRMRQPGDTSSPVTLLKLEGLDRGACLHRDHRVAEGHLPSRSTSRRHPKASQLARPSEPKFGLIADDERSR